MRAMDDKGKMRQILDSSETLKKYFHKNEDDKKTFKRGGLTGIMLMQLHDYLQKPYETLDQGEKALKEKPNWLNCDDANKLKTELKKQLPVNWTKSVLYDKNVLQALPKINKKIIEIENTKFEELIHENAENKKSQSALPKKTPPPVPTNPKPQIRVLTKSIPPAPPASKADTTTPPPLQARDPKLQIVSNVIGAINRKAESFEDQTYIKTIEKNIDLMRNQLLSKSYIEALHNNYKIITEDLQKCLEQNEPYSMNNAICDIIKKIQVKNSRPTMPIPLVPQKPSTPPPTVRPAAAASSTTGTQENNQTSSTVSPSSQSDSPTTDTLVSEVLLREALKRRQKAVEGDQDDNDNGDDDDNGEWDD